MGKASMAGSQSTLKARKLERSISKPPLKESLNTKEQQSKEKEGEV